MFLVKQCQSQRVTYKNHPQSPSRFSHLTTAVVLNRQEHREALIKQKSQVKRAYCAEIQLPCETHNAGKGEREVKEADNQRQAGWA